MGFGHLFLHYMRQAFPLSANASPLLQDAAEASSMLLD